MMQFEVTASLLNIRRVIPMSFEDRSSIAGQVFRGFRFEAVEVPVEQIPNPALGRWFKDRDGFFYWGSAVIEIAATTPESTIPLVHEPVIATPPVEPEENKMSWGHRFYNIPLIWNDLGTKGQDAIIAVIDTGIDIYHEDLKSNIHPLSKSFVGVDNNFVDSGGHGTQMAGIIAATGVHKVIGVAPEAKLLVIKASQSSNDVDLRVFARAIEYAASVTEVDVVNISFSFLDHEPAIQSAIERCIHAGKIVLAAIGNRRNVTKPVDDDTFPSSYNTGAPPHAGVIGVGAFDKNGVLCTFSNWNPHLGFLAPGDRFILTTAIGNTSTNGSLTSIATAFTSGCVALMISYLKKQNPDAIPSLHQAILQTCDDIGPVIGYDHRSGYGRMNLRNAIAKIKNI